MLWTPLNKHFTIMEGGRGMKPESRAKWVLLPVLLLLMPHSLAGGGKEMAAPESFEGARVANPVRPVCGGYTEIVSDGSVGFTAEIDPGRIMLRESSVEYLVKGPAGTERLILHFEGCGPVIPEGRQELPGTTNYLMTGGEDIVGARSFEYVFYEHLWDGIDLVYGFQGMDPKYEFVVHPGADIEDITVRVSGAEDLHIDEGDLVMRTFSGMDIRDTGLAVNYLDGGARLDASFGLLSGDSYSFLVENWDGERPITIDPVLVSTYLGGDDEEGFYDVVVDDTGYVYLLSTTGSDDFPRVRNEVLSEEGILGGMVSVTKFEPDLLDVVFTTIFGGSDDDIGMSMALDGQQRIWIAGYTGSGDLQVTDDALQEEIGDYYDGFVLCLSSDGSQVEYCTYLGGDRNDHVMEIAALSDGSVVVGGMTYSVTGSITATEGALNIRETGDLNSDIFIMRFFPFSKVVSYIAFIGGSGEDILFDMKLDDQFNVYITGTTWGNFPITEGSPGEEYQKIFLTKIDPTGAHIRYSARIGGDGPLTDSPYCLEVLGDGSVIIAGRASDQNFPGRPPVSSRRDLGFVLKMDPGGKEIVYSRVMDIESEFFDVEIGGQGRLCLVGYSDQREDVIESNGAIFADPGDDHTGIIVILSGEDLKVEYLGTLGEYVFPGAVRFLDDGTLLVGGEVYYQNLPGGPEEGYDDTLSDHHDLFLLRMDLDPNPLPPTNLTIKTGYRKAYLSWVRNANETFDGVPTYEIHRTERLYSYGDDEWELIGVVSGQESYIDEEVEFDHTYFYRVVTRFGSNTSRPTDNLMININSNVPAPVFVEAKVENGTVTLRWEIPEPDYSEHVMGFIIRRTSVKNGFEEEFENIRADDRTWTDRWVKEGDTCKYNIEAVLLMESYSDPDQSQRSETLVVRVPYREDTKEVEEEKDWIAVMIAASMITFIILVSAAAVLYFLPDRRVKDAAPEE